MSLLTKQDEDELIQVLESIRALPMIARQERWSKAECKRQVDAVIDATIYPRAFSKAQIVRLCMMAVNAP